MTGLETLASAGRSLTRIAQRTSGELLGNARAALAVLKTAGRDVGAVVAETAAELRREPGANVRSATKSRATGKKNRPAARRGAALV